MCSPVLPNCAGALVRQASKADKDKRKEESKKNGTSCCGGPYLDPEDDAADTLKVNLPRWVRFLPCVCPLRLFFSTQARLDGSVVDSAPLRAGR